MGIVEIFVIIGIFELVGIIALFLFYAYKDLNSSLNLKWIRCLILTFLVFK